MTILDRPPRYRSYLLAYWEERSQDPSAPVIWRFSLEDPHTGQRRGFASLEALVAVLQREMDRQGMNGPARDVSGAKKRVLV